MKKGIISLLILVILFSLSSFGQNKTEKLLIGTWENDLTEVEKLDKVAESLLQANITYLEQQKDLYTSQMLALDDSNKAAYEKIIVNIDNQLAQLNVDTIKEKIKNNYSIGTFIFNKDKTLTIKTKQDSIIGSWVVNEDTLNLTIQNEVIPLIIKHISRKRLILVQNNSLDTLKFDITYYFKKE